MTPERWIALTIACLLFIMAVLTARRSQRRGDGFVTALGLFSFVWGSVLALFALPLVRYTTTPVVVWLIIYGSLVTFTVGAFCAHWRHRGIQRVEPEEREKPDARRLRLTWIAFAFAGFVGFAAFVHAVDAVIGWHSLFDDPTEVRKIQTTSTLFSDTYGPWKHLTYCSQIAFLLWTLGVRERCFEGRWRVAWALGPLSLVPFTLTGDRTLMLLSLVWAVLFHLMYRPPRTPRRLAVGSVAVVLALLLVFGVLGARVDKTIDSHPEIARVLTTRMFDPLALPYVYVTGNPPTLARLVEDPLRPHTAGQMTILPAVKVLHALGVWGQPPEVVGAFYPIPFETFNNYSWLGTFYLDFGVIGCLLLPLLFAYVATFAVMRAVRRRTLLSIWTASLLLYCVALAPMLPKVSDTLTWQYLLAGPLVVVLVRQRPDPHQIVRQLVRRAHARPRLAGAATVAAASVFSLALVGVLSAPSSGAPPRSEAALRGKLKAVAQLADLTRTADVFPTSIALASRLHVHDPGERYVALPTADAIADSQSIGVFTSGGRLVLRGRASAGTYVSLDTASLGPDVPTTAPGGDASPQEELVVNGGFEDGYSGWHVSPDGIAQAALIPRAYRGRQAIAISGTGADGPPLTMLQSIHVRADAGACFAFSVRVRRSRLSRSLFVWASLVHSDGTSDQLIVGRPKLGLGPGNDRWRGFRVLGRATASVRSIVVFAADTGGAPLTGTAYVDSLSLQLIGGPRVLTKLADLQRCRRSN